MVKIARYLMASRVSPGFSVVGIIFSFCAEKFSDLSHLLHNIIHLSYTDFLTHTTFFVIAGVAFFLR
jgi:NADH:ubiquinone oxidoreductase subunit 2 (subunit N)